MREACGKLEHTLGWYSVLRSFVHYEARVESLLPRGLWRLPEACRGDPNLALD